MAGIKEIRTRIDSVQQTPLSCEKPGSNSMQYSLFFKR